MADEKDRISKNLNSEDEQAVGRNEKGKRNRKNKKANAKGLRTGDSDNDEETLGSKIFMALVAIIIIAIWLLIFGLLIKFDVGGFGSTVLHPALKNVPLVNKVLPDVQESQVTEDSPYDTLEEAVDRVKELEKMLDQSNVERDGYLQQIESLNGQIANLDVYRQNQADFEVLKEKFYEEVVFSDRAPDIEQYKTFYEGIAPENAEILYRQVVEQLEADKEVQQYADTYAKMKPKAAAQIFDSMTDNLDLVAKILKAMPLQSRSDILSAMNPQVSAKLTEIMEP